jgi:tetratricopeptide (TPR) repeat protein
VDYLNLSAADQRKQYLANLQRNAAADPSNARWKMRLGRELLAEGKTAEGLATLRELRAAQDPAILAASGRILVEFEQFQAAREFLEPAVAAAPSLGAARLDLAIALFHAGSAEDALRELDKTADRNGDYYLLRAQILDAQGKTQLAAEALNLGIRAAPTRASLYFQATAFLLKHKLYHEAQDLLEQASRILPDERELQLAQVVTLELLRRNIDAEKLLARMQARWPEWGRPYLLSGILLEIQLKSAEARQTLETAIALGAEAPEAYYYQALAITHAAPDDLNAAQKAIERAMQLTSKDPYVFLLAGKISLARKEYAAAIERLQAATRLQPTLIPAHYALRDAYKALGDEQKSADELEAIKHIASESSASEQSPFSMEDFLFTVRPPG